MKLKEIENYSVDIPEPSGLSLSFFENEFLTVSDKTAEIYRISEKGKVIDKLKYKGKDLEGITINSTNKKIYCIEEKKKKIIKTDINGKYENEFNLPKSKKKDNDGIEGITYNCDDQSFYILKEKKPGKLINWSPEKGIIFETKLDFAKDYSGIFYSKFSKTLWIVSDDSKILANCTLNGKLLDKSEIPVKQAEGIVVYEKENLVYIISDKDEELYLFKIER